MEAVIKIIELVDLKLSFRRFKFHTELQQNLSIEKVGYYGLAGSWGSYKILSHYLESKSLFSLFLDFCSSM